MLHAKSAVVYDINAHKALLEKNPDEVMPLASMTKLMTAMVALDQNPALDETLVVSGEDVDHLKHSASRVPVGTQLERKEMLRLALMSSENRSASAVSRNALPGGLPTFVASMNQKAQALGMTHTHFDDSTGLSPQNVSTANDVVKMADAASHYALIHQFTTLTHYDEDVGTRKLSYHNSDPMVGRPGWDIQLSKTGFTNEAGRCVVVKVNMPTGPVVIALMGADTSGGRSSDMIAIRNWLEGKPATFAPRLFYAGAKTGGRHAIIAARAASGRKPVMLASARPGHGVRTGHVAIAQATERSSNIRLVAYSGRSAPRFHPHKAKSGKHRRYSA
ncbi:D-alanyl-D-alanine carboxypeptidase [Paraburkholderia sp. UCT31]|nr:D-alanyl-D-alanine carboxypeptidase [Paraburkholderia sp. UCT31]